MINHYGVHEKDITKEEIYDVLATILVNRIADVLFKIKGEKGYVEDEEKD